MKNFHVPLPDETYDRLNFLLAMPDAAESAAVALGAGDVL